MGYVGRKNTGTFQYGRIWISLQILRCSIRDHGSYFIISGLSEKRREEMGTHIFSLKLFCICGNLCKTLESYGLAEHLIPWSTQ